MYALLEEHTVKHMISEPHSLKRTEQIEEIVWKIICVNCCIMQLRCN